MIRRTSCRCWHKGPKKKERRFSLENEDQHPKFTRGFHERVEPRHETWQPSSQISNPNIPDSLSIGHGDAFRCRPSQAKPHFKLRRQKAAATSGGGGSKRARHLCLFDVTLTSTFPCLFLLTAPRCVSTCAISVFSASQPRSSHSQQQRSFPTQLHSVGSRLPKPPSDRQNEEPTHSPWLLPPFVFPRRSHA